MIGCVFGVLLLSACATGGRFNTQRYVVNSGDTLHFIAWKYQINVEDLARWNNLKPPYRINPGERLVLFPRSNQRTPKSSTAIAQARDTVIVEKGDTLYSLSRKYRIDLAQFKAINDLSSPYTLYPGQSLRLKAGGSSGVSKVTVPPKKSPQKPPKNPAHSKPFNQQSPKHWRWPTKGRVVARFKGSESTQKGVDISGTLGQDVIASAAGKVVYSGQGIPSYGHLVLIKHNERYMSAYAYNSRLLVKEGQTVKAGQKIASMGQQGLSSPRLHFEIRKNGQPVNPVSFLPKR